jgi:HAD superfamily hydrolase (TIGR01549 family)
MIRGVIFDLGNTLMYFDGDWDKAAASGARGMADYLNSRGYPVPEEFSADFVAFRSQGRDRSDLSDVEYTAEQALRDTLSKHAVCYVPDEVLPRALIKYFEHEEPLWRPYPDARGTLDILQDRGLKLGLLSNASDHASVERIARRGGVSNFLNPFLSSAALGHRKPDPRAFRPILETWHLAPDEIVMVGDWPSFDILGAHRSGIRGILIEDRWPMAPRPHGEFADSHHMEPDATIHSLGELPRLLEKLGED